MTEKNLSVLKPYPLAEAYAQSIPEDLHDLLLPDRHRLVEFSKAVKALRIREKERDYVRELQLNYGVPLRPNESVKETMVRVRLAIVKLRRSRRKDSGPAAVGPLPVDPLE